MFEPPLTLAFVLDDHFLRYPVDIPERHRGDPLEHREAHPRIEPRGSDLVAGELEQQFMPESVGPNQRIHRYATLSHSAGVLQCRGRWFDLFDRDLVLQGVEDGIDVALDARTQQFDQPRIVAQLGDVARRAAAGSPAIRRPADRSAWP